MQLLQKLILTLSIFPITSYAKITTCNIVEDQNPFNAQIISWDDKKNKAEITTGLNQKFEGVVIHSKDYEYAKKVNIYITYKIPYLESDAVEYIIFPISNTEYGVSSVQYTLKKKKQFLEAVNANQVALCKVNDH